jgi:hypothetical protein
VETAPVVNTDLGTLNRISITQATRMPLRRVAEIR